MLHGEDENMQWRRSGRIPSCLCHTEIDETVCCHIFIWDMLKWILPILNYLGENEHIQIRGRLIVTDMHKTSDDRRDSQSAVQGGAIWSLQNKPCTLSGKHIIGEIPASKIIIIRYSWKMGGDWFQTARLKYLRMRGISRRSIFKSNVKEIRSIWTLQSPASGSSKLWWTRCLYIRDTVEDNTVLIFWMR